MFCNVKRERGTFVCATFFNLQTEQTVLGRIFSTFSFLPSFPLPFITQCSERSRKRLKTCSRKFAFHFNSQLCPNSYSELKTSTIQASTFIKIQETSDGRPFIYYSLTIHLPFITRLHYQSIH